MTRLRRNSNDIAQSNSMKRSFLQVWWLELACCLLATCMLGAMVGTLLPYQDKPLPGLPYHLSVNTLISVFTTVMKTCNLIILAEGLSQLKWEYFRRPRPLLHLTDYDSATQGPWGCLQLLVALRGRGILTAIGAILSVLVIAVDPFAQQLISYYPCNVPATNGTIASIPRSSVYNETDYKLIAGDTELSTAQKNVIITGLFDSDSVRTPTDCATGNCTFPDAYATVGFCSECADVTDELDMFWSDKTYITKLPSGLNTSMSTISDPYQWIFSMGTNPVDPVERWFDIDTDPPQDNECGELPVEFILGKLFVNKTDPIVLGVEYNDQWYAEMYGGYGDSPSSSCSLLWQNQTWGCRGYGAARCKLKPCVKILQSKVDFATVQETVIATYSDWFLGYPDDMDPSEYVVSAFYQLAMADLDCVDDATKVKLRDLGFKVTKSRFMPYNVALHPLYGNLTRLYNPTSQSRVNLSNSQIDLVPPTCIYQMDFQVAMALQRFMGDFFNQQINPLGQYGGVLGQVQTLRIFNNSYVGTYSISQTWTSVAKALTNKARQWDLDRKGTYGKPAQGVVYVTSTCMHAQWPWMAYPATMAFLTMFFLAGVLIQTETLGRDGLTRGWKSSSLPLIYHDMIRETKDGRETNTRADNIQQMSALAKQEYASLLATSSAKVVESTPLRPHTRQTSFGAPSNLD